jgi:regulator of sirC expression with transglutaminase-like and TPR domain
MPPLPQFLAQTPLEYFALLVADDENFSLLEAAISLGQDDNPALDTQSVLHQIDAHAARLKSRLPADAGPRQRLRILNQFFFQELGFAGNVNNYYDPANSMVAAVLETRRGIPITLALLYIEFASQAGLTARGVSFPGHFLVKLKLSEGEVVLDPFTGQSLSRERLDELLLPYRRRQGLVGELDVPLGVFLQAAAPRDVLARMLRNLKEIYRAAADAPRLLAVLNRLVVLLPQAWDERRDRGLVLADLGAVDAAVHDLGAYLAHSPQASDREAIGQRVLSLREPGAGPLH